MRWFFLIVGGLATALMLAISMRLNFLFGFSLGQTTERAWVFGSVSVISDAWKGLGPILILALLRERRWPSAFGAAAIWIVCFMYSVTSALGVAIEDRTARTGFRETLQMNYAESQAEIARLEQKRKGLRPHRAASEVEAAISALLAKGVISNQRTRGTIGSLSDGCQRTDPRTIEACAEVSKLREELAAANEERDLDSRLVQLAQQARELREHGGARAADPQAQLLARLSRGAFTTGDIGPALAMLLAMMIELISSFGGAVLAAYADVTVRKAPATSNTQSASVIGYLAERVEPAAANTGLAAGDLHADYYRWSLRHHHTPLPLGEFILALDHIRADKDLKKIRKRKDRYYGIRLSAARRASAT